MLLSAFTTLLRSAQDQQPAPCHPRRDGNRGGDGCRDRVISVTLKAEQGISGIGVYLFGLGFSDLLFIKARRHPFADQLAQPDRHPAARSDTGGGRHVVQADDPRLRGLPAGACRDLRSQPDDFRMKIRAAGENPAAADSVGVNVARIRWSNCAHRLHLGRLAGAAFSFTTASSRRTSPRARASSTVALVYFGAWRPTGVMGGSGACTGWPAQLSRMKSLG